jgi:hypothetical protein
MHNRSRLRYGLIIALMAGSTLALGEGHQSNGHGHGKGMHGDPEQRMERMRQHLGLSDEQVTEMRAIRESDATREEKRERMRAVLTNEQREKMAQHRATRQQHGGPNKPRRAPLDEADATN